MARTSALIAPVQPVCTEFCVVTKHCQMHTNTMRHTQKQEFRVQWGWVGCIRCEKFENNFMAQTCALIAPVQPVLHWVSCSNDCQMHPNTTRCTKTWVYGPMGWIGCVCCEKFWCDFVARTFALIALVQPVLHQASCSNETIQNALNHYECSNTWV